MRAETTFDLVGDLIGVDAIVTGPAGTAQVKLILDTAAVLTTMVPSVAESIGYSEALRVGRGDACPPLACRNAIDCSASYRAVAKVCHDW